MKVLFDLNVLLDVVQRREPFYAASAGALDLAAHREVEGCMASHALTTLHYILRKYAGRERADEVVDWVIEELEPIPAGRKELQRARGLGFRDFEDAVTASTAEAAGCDLIVTRNVKDSLSSPVEALTPEELLAQL